MKGDPDAVTRCQNPRLAFSAGSMPAVVAVILNYRRIFGATERRNARSLSSGRPKAGPGGLLRPTARLQRVSVQSRPLPGTEDGSACYEKALNRAQVPSSKPQGVARMMSRREALATTVAGVVTAAATAAEIGRAHV